MKSLTDASQVVPAFSCTLKIFLVTLDEALDLILFPVPYWKTQNSKTIPHNSSGQNNKQIRFTDRTASNVYPATESDSILRLTRMLVIVGQCQSKLNQNPSELFS